MNQTVNVNYSSINRVAIIDDDIHSAEVASWDVEEAGFEPLIVQETFQDVMKLVDFTLKNAEGAICDHRLAPLGLANFHGASVVAALYEKGFPAILVTQFIMDMDVSIRKWRHKVPVVLSRDKANYESIRDGIMACRAELNGYLSPSRKPHRVLLKVMGVTQESNETVIDVIIPSWNPNRAVRLPSSLLPKDLATQVTTGMHMIANVNIGAENEQDLYFYEFEQALEPEENDGLA